ncbi:MAG: alpha/beta fold hydrolase [Candidatus Obscuribacterales bacterium]|nr:alpha/beta fold hydrolase [Candidatus Obscuribacterales bacterium]
MSNYFHNLLHRSVALSLCLALTGGSLCKSAEANCFVAPEPACGINVSRTKVSESSTLLAQQPRGPVRRLRQKLKNKRNLDQPDQLPVATPKAEGPDKVKQLPVPIPVSGDATDQALQLILADKVDQAKDLLTRAYNEQKRSDHPNPNIPYFLAAIEAHSDRYGNSLKYLLESQAIQEKFGSDIKSQILLTKRLGDSYYKNRDMKSALASYNAALFLAQKDKGICPVLYSEILESLVGAETNLKMFDAAERHCREHIDFTRAQIAQGGIPAYLDYSWALFQLAEILRKTNKPKEFEEARKQSRDFMNQLIQVRMIAENAKILPSFEEMQKVFRSAYVKALEPGSPAEIAWAGNDFRVKTLPVILWRPTGKPVAAVICIHGLGLENRAFTATAQKLTERGYLVGALDVRGFGAWVMTRGEEDVDYEQCLGDIEEMVKITKQKNPNVPVFILGESMGGAIALRAAAKLGPQINGVISSVPSAERFEHRKMSLQTAMHFIVDPNKPFSIGDYVADRATSEQSVRDQWANDPKAKLELSPIELMKFNNFMRLTKRHAEDIKDLPVLMLQGLKDRLVKPKGTFELFEAVSSEDKTILVQGLSEHLMFENPNPDMVVIDAVDSWLKRHLDNRPVQTSNTSTDVNHGQEPTRN